MRLVFYFSVKIYMRFRPVTDARLLKSMASMATTLFYYEILRLFLEGYLELVTACWLNFYAPDRSSSNFVFGMVFSVAVLAVCFLALPAAAIVTLLPQFRHRLAEDKI